MLNASLLRIVLNVIFESTYNGNDIIIASAEKRSQIFKFGIAQSTA